MWHCGCYFWSLLSLSMHSLLFILRLLFGLFLMLVKFVFDLMRTSGILPAGIAFILYPNVVLGLSDQAGSVRAGPRVSRDGFGREMPECFHFFRLHVAANRCSPDN